MTVMDVVFRGLVFSVEVGERQFPNGGTHRVEIVRHVPSVVLIPVEPDLRVLIVKQYRAPLDRETWEFPAGSVIALSPGPVGGDLPGGRLSVQTHDHLDLRQRDAELAQRRDQPRRL